jgi:hypothetical protein
VVKVIDVKIEPALSCCLVVGNAEQKGEKIKNVSTKKAADLIVNCSPIEQDVIIPLYFANQK